MMTIYEKQCWGPAKIATQSPLKTAIIRPSKSATDLFKENSHYLIIQYVLD